MNGIIDRITWRTKLTSRDWKRTRSVLKREHSLRNAPVNTSADIVGLFESCVLSVPKLSLHHHGIIYTCTPLCATHATFFATLPPSRRFLRTSVFTVLVDPTNTDSSLHDVTRLSNIAIVIASFYACRECKAGRQTRPPYPEDELNREKKLGTTTLLDHREVHRAIVFTGDWTLATGRRRSCPL